MTRWVCGVCDYEYIEAETLPPASPGTLFEDLLTGGVRLRCGKEAFMRVDEEEVKDEEDYIR